MVAKTVRNSERTAKLSHALPRTKSVQVSETKGDACFRNISYNEQNYWKARCFNR